MADDPREFLGVREFVNADVIAQVLSAFHPKSTALDAGRVMLARLRHFERVSKRFYENVDPTQPRLLAVGVGKHTSEVLDVPLWTEIERQYGCGTDTTEIDR